MLGFRGAGLGDGCGSTVRGAVDPRQLAGGSGIGLGQADQLVVVVGLQLQCRLAQRPEHPLDLRRGPDRAVAALAEEGVVGTVQRLLPGGNEAIRQLLDAPSAVPNAAASASIWAALCRRKGAFHRTEVSQTEAIIMIGLLPHGQSGPGGLISTLNIGSPHDSPPTALRDDRVLELPTKLSRVICEKGHALFFKVTAISQDGLILRIRTRILSRGHTHGDHFHCDVCTFG
jgi:hypothetical protein